jgi:hypothetical protein
VTSKPGVSLAPSAVFDVLVDYARWLVYPRLFPLRWSPARPFFHWAACEPSVSSLKRAFQTLRRAQYRGADAAVGAAGTFIARSDAFSPSGYGALIRAAHWGNGVLPSTHASFVSAASLVDTFASAYRIKNNITSRLTRHARMSSARC